MKKIATLLTLLIALAAVDARANLITNGSFETPSVPVGSFVNYGSGSTSITGWTVVGNQVSVVSGSFTQNGISFPAEDGSQWLDLTGDGSNQDTEGVEQTVATNLGDEYTLSFWVGNVDNPGGIFGTTSTVDLYIDGSFVEAYTNSSTNTTTQVWEEFSISGMPATTSTTFEFLNGDPSGDNTNGLDNVVLVDDSSATAPEPSSLLLLGSGLLGLAGWARRRSA